MLTRPPRAEPQCRLPGISRGGGARQVPSIAATDGERLMQFRVHGDELAFRAVVETHAAMVWGVCWQVLRRREDVEDAFQATFLILARKCSAIRAADSAAGWLYRVAFRTALAARAQRRRQATELLAVDPPGSLEDQLASIERSEQCDALLEELHALGHCYRQPLVLCYLEGRSRQQAADELGVTLASVKGRLARGLRMLRTRLAMRGMALSGAAALMSTEMNLAGASVSGAPVAQAISQAATACTSAVWLTPAASSGAGAAADASIRAGAVLLAKKGILTMKFAAAIKPTLGALAIGFTYGALALAGGQSADGGPGASTEGEGAVSRAAAPAVVELTGGEIATPDGGAPSGAAVLVAPAAWDYAEWMATAPAPGGVPRAATTTVAPGAASPALPHLAPAADVFVAAPQPIVAPQVIPLPGATPSSGAAVALEAEHWKLKASGLQKKVESLRLKARALREQRGPDVEIQALEVESEVDLTLAEVKLCEARAEQLREGLEQRPSAAWGPPAATASPPAATSPIQAPTPAGMPDWNSHAYPYPTSGPPAGGGADGPSPGPADQTAPELHANALAGHRERLRAAIQELEAVTTTIIPEAENELAKQLAKQLEQLRAMNEKLQARLDELERQNKIQRPTIAY